MTQRALLLFALAPFAAIAPATAAGPIDNLTQSIEEGQRARVIRLLDEGAPIHGVDSRGWTPLCRAAACGRNKIIGDLVKRGAKVNERTGNRNTPLMFAATRGHLKTVRKLVELGAKPSAKNSRGETALDGAVRNNHAAIVLYLLKLKAR